MKEKIKYTNAPKHIEESLERSVVVPNFELTPESVKEFTARRAKKPINLNFDEEIEAIQLQAVTM